MSSHESTAASWGERLKLPLVLLAAMLVGAGLVSGIFLLVNGGPVRRAAAPEALPPAAPAAATAHASLPSGSTGAGAGADAGALPNPHGGSAGATAVPRLAPAEAKAQLDGGTVAFVDVRGGEAFAKGHIAGALSITAMDLEERLKALPSTTLIVVYGEGDEAGAAGAQILREGGLANVAALDGGIAAWRAAGYPLATGNP